MEFLAGRIMKSASYDLVKQGTFLLLAGLLATAPGYAAPATKYTAPPAGAIRHVVVIFQENVSFDHYFATYPNAVNAPGEPVFHARPNTPKVDGLQGLLLTENPNFLNKANGAGSTNPFRLSRSQAVTADQDHGYQAEQLAFNDGKMDLFPKSVGKGNDARMQVDRTGVLGTTGLTMGYYDGNTVTAYWNYAQHFAMSDRHFNTNFGPSTPGALNLVSGQLNGVVNDQNAEGSIVSDGNGGYTVIADPQPVGDACSSTSDSLVHMTGRNVGDLLTAANVSWGFFQGGFDLTAVNANGTTGCRRSSMSLVKINRRDYLPHHEPFQYYKTTANWQHARPLSAKTIGANTDGAANHQYDAHDFVDALAAGNFPAVAFLKAPAYQDGHAGYSSPLDEQKFVVQMVNLIQQQPDWEHTVIFIAYDDSDGWYDHVASPLINGSATRADQLNARGRCGDGTKALAGVNPDTAHAQGRCGYGPRLPLIALSPWAKENFVAHSISDQTSILRFIEDVFLHGARIGQGSFDASAGSLNNLFDFSRNRPRNTRKLFIDPESGLEKVGN